MNAFSAGSNANIHTVDMEYNQQLKKQQSNTDIYGNFKNPVSGGIGDESTGASKLSNKIQNGIGAPLLLNQPSAEFDSFAQIENRNNNFMIEDDNGGQNYDWDGDEENAIDNKPIMIG